MARPRSLPCRPRKLLSQMRKYHKLSRKLAKAVMPFALRKYEREQGKINKTPGGILFFLRDLDPARMLAKFRDNDS